MRKMICEKDKCTGCFACYNICPKNAIEMKEDIYGNIYPEINETKCINCNLCKKVCPNLSNINFKFPVRCYAAKTKDKNVYLSTASGGIATTISKEFIEKKGIIYGAAVVGKNVEHIRVDKIEDLYKLKGSKYVHSHINKAYKKIKEDLLNKCRVLFIGTPCQVSGLKKFLMCKYDNLYTIDLICHGVPSQKMFEEEIRRMGFSYNDTIEDINFRYLNQRNLKIKSQNKEIIQNCVDNFYYNAFLNSIIIRENCYSCKYAQNNRVGDITLGDFWGLKDKLEFIHDKGVNCVLINTEKGNQIFENIKKYIDYEEQDVNIALNGNDQLNHPSLKPECRDYFIKYYPLKGYNITLKKILRKKIFIEKIKIKLKNTNFFNLYKKIKGEKYE